VEHGVSHYQSGIEVTSRKSLWLTLVRVPVVADKIKKWLWSFDLFEAGRGVVLHGVA
jgi:hypothetical protein